MYQVTRPTTIDHTCSPMLPFEFTVLGPPVSQQTRRRSALGSWKAVVATAALNMWPANDTPLEEDISLTITHFYEGAPADIDNIVKPILDSMKTAIYRDDFQITDLASRRRPLGGPFLIEVVSPVLAAALDHGKEFLHIRITEPPVEGELRF